MLKNNARKTRKSMASSADIIVNEVPLVKTIASLLGLSSDGSLIQITAKDALPSDVFVDRGYAISDFNNAGTGIYTFNSTTAKNQPEAAVGVLLAFKSSSGYQMQIYKTIATGGLYIRVADINNHWYPWYKISSSQVG